MQADYDAAAPMQDILAQIAADDAVLSPIQPLPAPVKYAFEERARIAQAFFNPPLSAMDDRNLDRQIAVVDDFASLYTRQERRPQQSRQSWEDDTATSSSDDDTSDVEIKSECSDSDKLLPRPSPLQCRPFQCLHCIGDTRLPTHERQHNFGSMYSLERHFNRHPQFQPGENCPFPSDGCAKLALKSLMDFKHHAAEVHKVCMSDRR